MMQPMLKVGACFKLINIIQIKVTLKKDMKNSSLTLMTSLVL